MMLPWLPLMIGAPAAILAFVVLDHWRYMRRHPKDASDLVPRRKQESHNDNGCKLIGVHEVEKAPNVWCKHACSKGCGIYEDRPPSCRSYECGWLSGGWRPELRPDRCKVIVEGTGHEDRICFRVVPEHFLGAWRRDDIMDLIGKCLERGISVCYTDYRRAYLFKLAPGAEYSVGGRALRRKRRWVMMEGECTYRVPAEEHFTSKGGLQDMWRFEKVVHEGYLG